MSSLNIPRLFPQKAKSSSQVRETPHITNFLEVFYIFNDSPKLYHQRLIPTKSTLRLFSFYKTLNVFCFLVTKINHLNL